jgi:hypothetical protein
VREQLDSYGRIGVGALVGAAVAALLYGGLAYGNETPVDLARHPEMEPVQPGGRVPVDDNAVAVVSVTPGPSGSATTATTTTTASSSSTTTTMSATTTTTTTTAAPPQTTTTIEQPPPVTTTTHHHPTSTTRPCHFLIC